jgi:hypothetical protein
VDDGPVALGRHVRHEQAVQADDRQEVGVEIGLPAVIGCAQNTVWNLGVASGVVDEHIDAAQAFECGGRGRLGAARFLPTSPRHATDSEIRAVRQVWTSAENDLAA